ncbi:hypothetical protein BH10PSE13_BH10PSE13_24930 [soil metagenome]
MATVFLRGEASQSSHRFYFIMAVVMALVLVAGFSFQLAAGRSSFSSPLLVHVHGMLFFGWTFFYVLQTGLAANGSLALHRRLGWVGAGWTAALVVIGCATVVTMVRKGTVPFFFTPLGFLLMDALSLLTFAGLVVAAIVMRRRTEWHRRLIYCGMALLTGPGWGRLLPMPFLIPWADWVVFGTIMIFPLVGVIADLRRSGREHAGWWVGIAAMTACQLSIGLIGNSPAGLMLYRAATAGSPGAAIAPRAFPPSPLG